MPKFENCYFCKTSYYRSSSQDGGVGRNPSLPHTTQRRITTNLKSINNQKCQKIKLHGTLTTKELKKKSTRTTKPVRWQTGRTWWAGPLRKTEARLAVVRGGAGWRWNWTSVLTMDYGRGCCIKRNSQSHRGVPWKVHWRPAGELHCSLSGPSPTGSTTAQQRG